MSTGVIFSIKKNAAKNSLLKILHYCQEQYTNILTSCATSFNQFTYYATNHNRNVFTLEIHLAFLVSIFEGSKHDFGR